ncbi:MAG: response regulator [Oscillospiraceae bacterium]
MDQKINVLLVEDDPMAARHLTSIVNSSERYRLEGAIESASVAEAYCLAGRVELILMDVCTAMNASGVDAAIKIKKAMPHIKTVIVTSQLDADLVQRAREGQVDSFLYKLLPDEEILTAMDRTMAGERVYPDRRPKVQLGAVLNIDIDEQHMNVLRELCGAKTDEEIAAAVHLSVHTVRKYISELLDMTGFRNRTELAVKAQKLGIVTYGY